MDDSRMWDGDGMASCEKCCGHKICHPICPTIVSCCDVLALSEGDASCECAGVDRGSLCLRLDILIGKEQGRAKGVSRG